MENIITKLSNVISDLFNISNESNEPVYDFSFTKEELEIIKESLRENCYTDTAKNLLNMLNEVTL